MADRTRVYDHRHDYDPEHVLFLEPTDDGALGLIIVEDVNATAVQLDAAGVRQLRLALQRWERARA